ncbi:protein smoothened [Diorhabda carinulata]|uniref:protein smoothened n=1 Tax=Diorhabda sublineata TaxID=1163346 RepID=UPI0024E0E21E|nr:protein smoothened [Diorhabda sublineata]XP_057666621.1 protein smoothened [Diorhabda carinulata]
MKVFLLLIIYPHLVTCGTIQRKYLEESQFYDSFETESTPQNYSFSPHIHHKESKKTKETSRLKLYDLNLPYCQRSAKCQILNFTTCMGAKLPYHSTTLDLTDLKSQEKVQEKLQLYRYLKFIPKCWAVIQPFLCSLYMPKCEDDKVDLPSYEMCKITLEPCKILYNSSVFPEFFNCEDERLFPMNCKNDIHEVKFNTTGYCMDPLVKTDKQEWWYPDVEGCGLKCKDSLYTENEHYQIHKLIAYCTLFSMLSNIFTIATFVIDWKTANKYPALAIFYVNVCFCISYGGWLVQFLGSETREDIVCKKEGTLRKSEPCATENLSCVIVFVMVYYFMIAGLVWFVIFSYSWHMNSLQALGKIQDRVDRKRAYFHLVAWSFPLILTITTMAIGEIDGDYVTGICFVGFVTKAARAGLLLTPLAAAMIASGYIIVKGLLLLIKVKIESREIISEHSSRKIRSNIVRMGVFTIFMIVFCVITFGYHHYIFENSSQWNKSLQDYIYCKLTSLSSDSTHCKQDSRPSVAMLQLQLLAVFGSGIAMASWVWCDATLHAWGRYIRKKFHCEIEEPMKLQKHKIIAQAFAKRKKFNDGGQISILCQHHTDPVGLQFELNSAASNELSTTWAANLPRLVNRRGAVPNEVAYSASSNNHSMDSEVSLNFRHVSIESRRNSGDSQVSVQIAELKATRKVNSRRHRSKHRSNRQFRSHSRNISQTSRRLSKSGTKRESSTSLDSHLQIINALTNTGEVKAFRPNLSRRTGNAGLDGPHINNLLSNGKLRIPCNITNGKSGSEDENVSVTISESTFNMKLSNHANNLDLNDELALKSLRQGIHIEEIDSSSDADRSEKYNKDFEQEKRSKKGSGRDSHSSKRSRRSKVTRKKYSEDSDSCHIRSDSSSCSEIKQLVQSSLNSGNSVCVDKNRGSRQSKTSIDVAVQANAQDLDNELKNMKKTENEKHKSKQTKTKENRYRKARRSSEIETNKKRRISKEKYKNCGSSQERESLNRDTDEENLLDRKCKIDIKKMQQLV